MSALLNNRSNRTAASEHMMPTISAPCQETTGVLRDDASPELLVKDLQHRIRNLLSAVQCFVVNTEATTADDYRTALAARIATLSKRCRSAR